MEACGMKIIEIARRIELDYGHCLPKHYSWCSQIHGHRATVECKFTGEVTHDDSSSSNGMVIDFTDRKSVV